MRAEQVSTDQSRRALALELARQRLNRIKLGALGAGIISFSALTAGIATQVNSSYISSAQAAAPTVTALPAPTVRMDDDGQPEDGGHMRTRAGVQPGSVNQAPGIVSAQS